MTFITYEDYAAYNGIEIADADFQQYATRACEAVDAATGWQITQAGGICFYNAFNACIIMCFFCYTISSIYRKSLDYNVLTIVNIEYLSNCTISTNC